MSWRSKGHLSSFLLSLCRPLPSPSYTLLLIISYSGQHYQLHPRILPRHQTQHWLTTIARELYADEMQPPSLPNRPMGPYHPVLWRILPYHPRRTLLPHYPPRSVVRAHVGSSQGVYLSTLPPQLLISSVSSISTKQRNSNWNGWSLHNEPHPPLSRGMRPLKSLGAHLKNYPVSLG